MIKYVTDFIGTLNKGKNTVQLVYDKMDDTENKEQWGTLYFMGLVCRFISGRYGRGYAPRGKYIAHQLIEYREDNHRYKSMALFDIAFQIPIYLEGLSSCCSSFETFRAEGMDGIGIHPDGGIEGTLGCIGIRPDSKEHLENIISVIKTYFLIESDLYVEVL